MKILGSVGIFKINLLRVPKFLVLVLGSISFAADCTTTEKDNFLAQAQQLFNEPSLTTQMYENTENNNPRVRKLYLPTTTVAGSFYEFFKKENEDGIYVFHLKKANGKYNSFFINLNLTEVLYCDSNKQDVEVQWVSLLPKIVVNVSCNSDFNIGSDGSIQYFLNSVEIGGSTWKKNGALTPCNGKSNLDLTVYTPVN